MQHKAINSRRLAMPLTALAAAVISVNTAAQVEDAAEAGVKKAAGNVEEIIVTGTNVYRDRTNDINPTLSFDLDFFQRFEPLTVGEMLKRTPGVTFTSDVLEYDAVQLRGMNAEYTEVLINGRSIPGQGADRTFFVDRIPSELVERVEIIRSPSADMTSQGVAGSLNIILKDGAQMDGVSTRLGTTYYADDDKESRYTGAAAIAQSGDGYDFWLGANVQERRNPKQKVEEYFDDERTLEGYAFEQDIRDGTDSSLNGSLGFQLPQGSELRFNGYYVYTDRQENEIVDEYEGTAVSRADGDLVAIETQEEQIDQTSWGLDGIYITMLGGGEFELSAALSHFEEGTVNFETEEEFEDGVSQGVETDDERLDIEDDSYSLEGSYTVKLGNSELKSGIAYSRNERSGLQTGFFDVDAEIEETRIAPYTKLTLEMADNISLEGGLRYDIYERDVSNEDGSASHDSNELLPSLSLRWDATGDSRVIASVARTLRRPEFDLVSPFEEDETPDDEDLTVGNPDLESELAWGFDLGFEHRLPGRGTLGVNFFYRDIDDVIELTDTGVPYPDGGGTIFTPINIGSGNSRGVEFDISMPLAFMGLENTGFYANYAYLDSEIEDPFTGEERTFRNQPDSVYNVSLTQDIPGFGGAGISYQKRSESLATEFEEYVVTEYDGNLELFVEWNINRNSVLRFSGTNLLDQEKIEYIRDYGEPVNEIQYEESTPTYTVTWRAAY
ncbi:TonB-dependent receptor plug domain-containing protein [Microbulbifer rhizosphaerae]|uniref:Outer membrane receptor protein involved in Fe transport n=1 Tax=Microbulbifer rhizosphaerae TaxID=1562603 RepID=A0A7W4WFG4_9GAMM|nr:TonB-dependent receptor [Microbulbifer rhizosphaerae]MBB3063243.1 outer membrane receptor protein involved in Fe transport [Microbulbifer rhizosphaerae]